MFAFYLSYLCQVYNVMLNVSEDIVGHKFVLFKVIALLQSKTWPDLCNQNELLRAKTDANRYFFPVGHVKEENLILISQKLILRHCKTFCTIGHTITCPVQ